jgi:HPt (histidine-containing phosphotransfer) domain-containing protein
MSMKKSPARKVKKSKDTELNTLFAELKAEYIDTFEEKIAQIEKFWQQYNAQQLESEYHKIKGTGSTYGVKEATQVAEVMEDLCHQSSKQLGLCVLVSLGLFRKIRNQYKNSAPFELKSDPGFKFIRARQDELESA